MDTEVIEYDETLPVTQDWVDENKGRTVAFRVWVTLDELIWCDGWEGANALMDERIGTVLADVTYQALQPEFLEEVQPNDIKLLVTGEVAGF